MDKECITIMNIYAHKDSVLEEQVKIEKKKVSILIQASLRSRQISQTKINHKYNTIFNNAAYKFKLNDSGRILHLNNK